METTENINMEREIRRLKEILEKIKNITINADNNGKIQNLWKSFINSFTECRLNNINDKDMDELLKDFYTTIYLNPRNRDKIIMDGNIGLDEICGIMYSISNSKLQDPYNEEFAESLRELFIKEWNDNDDYYEGVKEDLKEDFIYFFNLIHEKTSCLKCIKKDGYKIIEYQINEANHSILLWANPIKDLYKLPSGNVHYFFTTYEDDDTELFLLPEKNTKIIQMAKAGDIWHPNESNYKLQIQTSSLHDIGEEMKPIKIHKWFWNNELGYDDLISINNIKLIPNIENKVESLSNKFYREQKFFLYNDFTDYVKYLAEGGSYDFFNWLFERTDFMNYTPNLLDKDFYNEYKRFLCICENHNMY